MAQANDVRTAEANGAETFYIPLVPTDLEGVTLPDLLEAYEYYRTPRASHPNSPSRIPLADLGRLATFDAFHLCETFLASLCVLWQARKPTLCGLAKNCTAVQAAKTKPCI